MQTAYCSGGKFNLQITSLHVLLQVSVMSMYENIAAGIVYVVPSPHLMTGWGRGVPKNDTLGHRMMYPVDTECPLDPSDAHWTASCQTWPHSADADFPWDKVEFYNSFFKDVIVAFDSWMDLRHKLDTVDFASMRRRGVELMDKHRGRVLKAWKEMLEI